MLFRHVTGRIVEVDENLAVADMYKNSPSWSVYKPKEKEADSIYSNMTKKELLLVAKNKQIEVSSKDTKFNIIKAIEKKDVDSVELNIEFTDNLIK